MSRKPHDARGEMDRRTKILSILAETYPHASIALTYRTPWELLVAIILSAQCTDVRVNQVTPKLFAQFPTIATFRDAPIEEIENAIKSTGFFHAKARNIQKSAKVILDRFSGEVPRTMEEMLTLPGVARKTANVVLGKAYGVVEGIAVDTHVIRLSQRLRLVDLSTIGGKIFLQIKKDLRGGAGRGAPTKGSPCGYSWGKTRDRTPINFETVDYIKDANPIEIEKELMVWIPKERWMNVTYELIDHGRKTCKAISPKCHECPLSSLCPASR